MEEVLKYNNAPIRMRNYGRVLQEMIAVAATEQDEETRKKMTIFIARSMRYKNMAWNKDQEAGMARIKQDILTLSDGRLSCDFPEFETEYQRNVPNSPSQQGRKKK